MAGHLKTMARNLANVVNLAELTTTEFLLAEPAQYRDGLRFDPNDPIFCAWVTARQSCFRASIDLENLCGLLHQKAAPSRRSTSNGSAPESGLNGKPHGPLASCPPTSADEAHRKP